jgi:hypothetical protein
VTAVLDDVFAARLARVEALLDELADTQPPRLAAEHPDLASFVAWLAATFARDVGHHGRRWCSRWADHPEAVLRLDALWQAHEALAAEGGTGPSTWLRDHLDPALARLMSDDGPFGRCATGERARHDLPPALPVEDAQR